MQRRQKSDMGNADNQQSNDMEWIRRWDAEGGGGEGKKIHRSRFDGKRMWVEGMPEGKLPVHICGVVQSTTGLLQGRPSGHDSLPKYI